jgi:uncharacterized protein (TIGR02996 family)
MHPEEEALLRALLSAPNDAAPRLIYADWLDEHDYPNSAAFYRRPVPPQSPGPRARRSPRPRSGPRPRPGDG